MRLLASTLVVLAALLTPATLLAQKRNPATPGERFRKPSAEEMKQRQADWLADVARGELRRRIVWVQGPADARLGDVADLGVPAYCRVTDEDGAKLFVEANGSPPTGSEVGALFCHDPTRKVYGEWEVVFSYDTSGLVKDDEQASLDHAALLETLKLAMEAGNGERRSRGSSGNFIVDWKRQPYYDPLTHSLTWSTRVKDNYVYSEYLYHSVRLLGRGGVMHAELSANRDQAPTAVAAFDSILTQYSFVEGQRYTDWREGDKVATYGLSALVAGAGGATAVKFGLFGKLWKQILGLHLAFRALIIAAVVAVGVVLAKVVGGRRAKAKAKAKANAKANAKAKAPTTPAKAPAKASAKASAKAGPP